MFEMIWAWIWASLSETTVVAHAFVLVLLSDWGGATCCFACPDTYLFWVTLYWATFFHWKTRRLKTSPNPPAHPSSTLSGVQWPTLDPPAPTLLPTRTNRPVADTGLLHHFLPKGNPLITHFGHLPSMNNNLLSSPTPFRCTFFLNRFLSIQFV